MLDQWGKEIGGPSIEARLATVEEAVNVLCESVVKLQQRTAAIINVLKEITNGVHVQPSQHAKGTDEEYCPGDADDSHNG